MPPKAKFEKEEIVKAALGILQKRGPKALTARELGTQLNSSARPIFTVFENMEEVRREAEQAAKEIYRGYVSRGLSQPLAFRGVGMAYIEFAIKEPKLFQLLFMGEQQEKGDVDRILFLVEDSYEDILRSVQEPYQLSEKDAKQLYCHMWIYTHGIAVMCATGVCSFTKAKIGELLTDVFISLLEKIKRGEKT